MVVTSLEGVNSHVLNPRGPWLWPTVARRFFDENPQRGAGDSQLERMFPDKRINHFTEADLVAFLNRGGLAPNTVANRKLRSSSCSPGALEEAHRREPAVMLGQLVPTRQRNIKTHNWLSEPVTLPHGWTLADSTRPTEGPGEARPSTLG